MALCCLVTAPINPHPTRSLSTSSPHKHDQHPAVARTQAQQLQRRTTTRRGGLLSSSCSVAVVSSSRRLRGERGALAFVPSNGGRFFATWLDNNAEVEVDVPVEYAFEQWQDRERIPQWMNWITKVKVSDNDSSLSQWELSQEFLGQTLSYSWTAKDLTPTKNQKIHWRSVDGLPNRGAVRFVKRDDSRCTVKLTITYQLPDALGAVGEAVRPVVESIIMNDMRQYAKYAVEEYAAQHAARV